MYIILKTLAPDNLFQEVFNTVFVRKNGFYVSNVVPRFVQHDKRQKLAQTYMQMSGIQIIELSGNSAKYISTSTSFWHSRVTLHTCSMQSLQTIIPNFKHLTQNLSMECSSMVSVAAHCPRDLGSHPSWFAVSNSNKKLSY